MVKSFSGSDKMAKIFREGESVRAKWPGSRRFEKAKIVSITEGKAGEIFKVQYKDKTFGTVTAADLKPSEGQSPRKKSGSPKSPKKGVRGRSTSKSPSRTPKERSVSRGRKGGRSASQSPARTKASKSPARGRSRSRSPSKTKPKPATPSPARSRSRSPTKAKPKPKPKPAASPARSRSRTPSKPKPKPVKTPSPKRKATKPKKEKSEELFSSPEASPSPVKKKAGRPAKSPATPGSPSRRKRQTKEQLLEGFAGKIELVPLLNKLTKANIQTLEKDVLQEEEEQVDSATRKIYTTRSKVATKLLGSESVLPPAPTKSIKMKAGIFGILFSILSMAFVPTITIYLVLNCVRKNYNLLTLPQIPKASAFFNLRVAAVYFGFVLLQFLLSAVPFGRIVRGFHSQHDRPRLQYRLNGLYSLLFSASLMGLLGYLGQPVYFVMDNFFKLTCTATAFSFVLAVALYVRALFRPQTQISQFADTGCTPYDFHHGRELHPRLGALFDLKLVTLRTGLTSWALVVISLTYKCYVLNSCVHYELALAAAAQLIYILDLLYREETILATAVMMYEGLGFGLLHAAYALAPFTFTLPVYFLVNQKPNMPLYCLGGMAAIFLFALVMNRKSLVNKTLVKRNPDSPAVTGFNKIVAIPHEKVLIASGWWGLIRHPNYTSEVLMFLAWTLPCGVQTALPYLPALLILLSLVRRCFQVEAIMARNYPEAYQQYKHRVPYRFCPYIF